MIKNRQIPWIIQTLGNRAYGCSLPVPGCGTPLGAEPGDIADTDMDDAAAPPLATAPTVASVAIVTAVSMISTAK